MAANTGADDAGLIARELGDEIVVVDQATETAHVLTGEAAEAWRASEDGMSRRTLLRRAGTVAVAGTVISIVMPEVLAAASGDATNTNLSLVPPVVTANQAAVLNVQVTDATNPATAPTGAVTLQDSNDPTNPQNATLTAGTASFNVTAGPAGVEQTFTATFVPSGAFSASIGTLKVTPLA
jgi:hypothetical protein